MSMYTPILRWKQGERNALKELDDNKKSCVRPLFVIADADRWSTFASAIGGIWRDGALALDLCGVSAEDMQQHLPAAVEAMAAANITWAPVVRPDMADDLLDQLYAAAREAGVRPILRIALEDIENSLSAFADQVSEIIIDLGELTVNDYRTKEQLTALQLPQVMGLGLPVTLAGSAARRDVSGLEQDIHNMVERLEWEIWNRLKTAFPQLLYGDYATVNPTQPDVPPGMMRPVAKIIYTRDGHWVIWRGGRVHGPTAGGFQQYYDLAKRVYDSGFFRGENFSYGDARIAQAARKEGSTGSLTTWVTVAVNHHLAEICALLASQSAS